MLIIDRKELIGHCFDSDELDALKKLPLFIQNLKDGRYLSIEKRFVMTYDLSLVYFVCSTKRAWLKSAFFMSSRGTKQYMRASSSR